MNVDSAKPTEGTEASDARPESAEQARLNNISSAKPGVMEAINVPMSKMYSEVVLERGVLRGWRR